MYQLDKETIMLRDAVREFAEKEVAPRADEIDKSGEFPWDMVKRLSETGFIGIPFAEEYGGQGGGLLATCIATEELARVCASTSLILACQELGATPIKLGASEEQKKKWLPALAKGEKICGFGLTEPEAGSDAGAMKSTAVKKGDKYILNGTKCFITNGGVSEVYTIFAMTDPSKGIRGISAFIVEPSYPGFSIGKHEDKMGIRGSQTTELIFEDCEVPAENLMFKEGKGFNLAMMTLDRTRAAVGAQGLGIAQGALDYTIDYMKNRVQFGAPISQLQALQFMVADLGIAVESSRSLLYRAATAVANDEPGNSGLSSMAKCLCTDTAMKVTTDCVQLCGGIGYMRDYPMERMMRDAKITQIYEGTNQIQRLVIARQLFS